MRRSALTEGTKGLRRSSSDPLRLPERAGGASRAPPLCAHSSMAAWVVLFLSLVIAASASSSAAVSSPRWTSADDLQDGFRSPEEGGASPVNLPYDGDVTPEERIIDQINAILQRTQGRLKSRQQQMLRAGQGRPADEDDDEEVGGEELGELEEVGEGGGGEAGLEAVLEGLLMPPPSPAREGRGPGFTFRFPPEGGRGQGRYFAVNPSDPKYYTATAIGRSGSSSWDEEEVEGEGGGVGGGVEMLEGGGGSTPERMRPLGRLPVVKPIKVVSTSGTEIPPLHSSEVDVLDGAATGIIKGNEGEGKNDKADFRMSHGDSEHRDKDTFIIPAEQVKRERPDKVPLDFGSDAYLTAIISGCTAAVVVGILAFAIFWYRLQRNAKAAADVEYPAYGVTGPNQEASAVAAAAAAASSVSPTPHSGGSTSPLSAGDRRLAQSAQMYHYQHQKQQIIAMESRASNERRGSVSEVDSEEENEEGDYTVYECPGLAPTGEMEVKNPLFHDDPTPATPSAGNNGRGDAGGGGKP